MPLSSSETRLRRLILLLLLVAMPGTALELLLLGHTEEWMQWVPLALLAVGFVVGLVVLARPGPRSVRTLQGLSGLSVVAGVVGVLQHYRGNVEFAMELYPTIGGLELFQRAMTGATPALAPGTMCLLGLLGLVYCHGHATFQTFVESTSSRGNAS